MITIKQGTAAWRERHLPECVKAVLRNTGQAALNIKLGRMAFFFLLFSLVKPQGISHSAPRHSASASFNKNLFSGQALGLGDSGVAESVLLLVFQWVLGFSKPLLYSPWQQPHKVLAGGLRFPLLFPNYSHSSLHSTSDTGSLPQTHPIYQPSLGTLPSSYSSEFITPICHLHHSPFKPWLVGKSMKAHCMWRAANHKIVFCHSMSLMHLVQSVGMGGEHFLQRFKVPCIDNKAGHRNMRKKINAKCKVTPMSQQAWEFLASQTRWTPRGFPDSAAFPHPNPG